jgi:hypothetical protein
MVAAADRAYGAALAVVSIQACDLIAKTTDEKRDESTIGSISPRHHLDHHADEKRRGKGAEWVAARRRLTAEAISPAAITDHRTDILSGF